jgi:hypothetical protein
MDFQTAVKLYEENARVYHTLEQSQDGLFVIQISNLSGITPEDRVKNTLQRLENLGMVRCRMKFDSATGFRFPAYEITGKMEPKERLYDGNVVTIEELVKEAGLDWKTATGYVSNLRKSGLIERVCQKATGVIGYRALI